jgi:hypothetical protein
MDSGRTPLNSSHLSDPLWRRLVRLLGRKRFGFGSDGDLVDWAGDALVAGLEAPALAVLAGLSKPPNGFEVDRYTERMLTELGVEAPSDARLAKLYEVAVAGDILEGNLTAYEGARVFYQLWLNGWPQHLQPWASFEDAYELARDGAWGDVAEVERAIREEAQRVVDRGVA